MKYCLFLFLLLPGSLFAQCANTVYGNFTCVQSPNAVQNSATVASNTVVLSFAAPATAGNGVVLFGSFCTGNPCTATGTVPVNITVTDNVNDTGFQACKNNGSIPYVRYWYCWWLPSVGAATTFTMHANASFSGTLWMAEIAGGCNTNACIGTDVPATYCMGPCGPQIITVYTNAFVIGMGYAAGTLLNSAAGWSVLSRTTAGDGIASFQPTTGPYTPTWTNTIMLQGLAVSIKSRTGSVSTQITVPTMPVP